MYHPLISYNIQIASFNEYIATQNYITPYRGTQLMGLYYAPQLAYYTSMVCSAFRISLVLALTYARSNKFDIACLIWPLHISLFDIGIVRAVFFL
jgi:hypothetical protein